MNCRHKFISGLNCEYILLDPKNVDYADSVNSMNTIKELIPELARGK